MLGLTKDKITTFFFFGTGAPSKTNYCDIFTDTSIVYTTATKQSSLQPDMIKDNLFQSVLINIQNALRYKIKNEC